MIKSMPGIREIAYHEERDELYCGYKGGKLVVFELSSAEKGPIYTLQAHDSDVTFVRI